MKQAELNALYTKMCEKAAANAAKIGGDMREFPASSTGEYFSPARETLRKTGHIFCWTQSFFTGMALLAARQTGDLALLQWCNSLYPEYRAKVFDAPADTMHDLGFLYTLYSTLNYRLTGDAAMEALSLRAAEVLAHRFVPNGRYIRAWGRMDDTVPAYVGQELAGDNFFAHSQGLAIIDCLMNLPLLFWAGAHTGDPFYTAVATAHADTVAAHFIRPDGSVCHAWRFDAATGDSLGEFNDCGYAVGSHWARGAAWAVYGYAVAARYTGEARYRQAALKVARAYLAACGENPLPVWDFRLPESEPARHCGRETVWENWDEKNPANRTRNIDSSAAAIMACGFLELLAAGEEEDLRAYVTAATDALAGCLNLDAAVPGLLMHTNGRDEYTSFGDYYVMELFARLLDPGLLVW